MNRQFHSFDEAIAYLEERGRLQYFGRAGEKFEYCVYKINLHDGREYRINVYLDGKVEVIE
jgi:hypothetical protein